MRTVALVLLLVALAAADSIAPLLHADGPEVINGSYIVILKDGLNITHRNAHIAALRADIAAAHDRSEIGWLYKIHQLIGFSATLTPAMLKRELSHAEVKYVECDQVVHLVDEPVLRAPADTITQTGATWGLDRIDQRNLPLDGLYVYDVEAGSGVDVYVIDTGILTTHVDFGGRATFAFSSITNEANTDLNGHGTHCAGTIGGTVYGVAKAVNLYTVKVLSAGGSGTTVGVVAGVDYVTNNRSQARPSIGSMSLGGGASTVMDQAVVNSIASGVHYSIAAGNNNGNACNYSPARVATAVTVGATERTDARASYSNFGTCVSIFAPGSGITSDWIGSNTATNTISGTSMATPHVAGVLALHLSLSPTDNPAAAKAWITATGTSGLVTNPGTGSPNILLYSPTQ